MLSLFLRRLALPTPKVNIKLRLFHSYKPFDNIGRRLSVVMQSTFQRFASTLVRRSPCQRMLRGMVTMAIATNDPDHRDINLICSAWEEAIIREAGQPDLPFDQLEKERRSREFTSKATCQHRLQFHHRTQSQRHWNKLHFSSTAEITFHERMARRLWFWIER